MTKKSRYSYNLLFSSALTAKLNYVQILGIGRKFFLAAGGHGKYKAFLLKKSAADACVPVCEAVKNVEIISCGQTGIFLRELGLYRGRLRVEAIAVNNVQLNVAIGTA
jgi:hypothetical protein